MQAIDKGSLEDYFAKLENIYTGYHIPDNAIYNLDEKGIMARSKVLVKKGIRLQSVKIPIVRW